MIAHGHFFGCPCIDFVEYHGVIYCRLCGLRDTSNRRADAVDLGSQQSDAGDCANSPGIVTKHKEGA